MYKKVDTDLNFLSREKEVLKFWEENKVFEKVMNANRGGEVFSFYDGPPTANGKPHIGHILTRVIKDIIPRYKTMKGKFVFRKAGWDTHGLPVELEVEKQLGIDGKQEIEKYGIEPFIHKCKESVWKYKGEWEKMSARVGYWADMENPYITYDNNYIESKWWAIKTIADKGLLYKGHKIVPYCPRCGTALSSHEVAQGYKDVDDVSAFVKFAAEKGDKYFLAWTTTPWTLPSNAALCMNPKVNYAEIESGGERYVLAENLVGVLFEDYKVLSVKRGKEYEHEKYKPLFDFSDGLYKEQSHYITCGAFVTTNDGTGIVHIAPAFGEDDSEIGRKYKLPFIQMVDDRGLLKPETKEFSGMFVKDADKHILSDLNSRGLLAKTAKYTHSYPFCWRCDTPLLYYARSSWFIKVTAVKDRLIAANNSVNWIPPNIKSGRMGNFLENVIDWGLSRERYWGTPLPVWVCADCGEIHVIGSRKELSGLSGCGEDIELHRPYIDRVTFPCKKCGGKAERTPEVIDCWFDSGSMPFAQFHYPFENEELFEQNFPADFISEAVDQTRGWFYTLLAISTLLFDKAPFKNCIVLGHVNDKNGIKMSKHKGNVVDPWAVLDKQGADAVRWYFYTASSPWLPSRFYEDAVSEAQRKFMGTLWNTYAFFVLYAQIDKYNPKDYAIDKCALTLMDKWILSKLNTLAAFVDNSLENYNITDSSRAIGEFCDILSNWYVRRCRERFWASDMTADKAAAYTTLYTVLVTVAKLSAPFTPFMAESIYQNLVPTFYTQAPVSVHLTDFPQSVESYIDRELEKGMDTVLKTVILGRAARNSSGIKNRQPLSKMMAAGASGLNGELIKVVLDELNIKNYEEIKSAGEFISYKLKPQLKTLGPKYGAKLGFIRKYLEESDASEIVQTVKGGGVWRVEGEDIEFSEADLLITTESAPGFVSASDKGITVVLDTALTKELLIEGTEREIVSKIQNMRKEAGFEVTDRIRVFFEATGRAQEVLSNSLTLKEDVLADSVTRGGSDGFTRSLNIEGDEITITLKKS